LGVDLENAGWIFNMGKSGGSAFLEKIASERA
jgi:hypothetical protein